MKTNTEIFTTTNSQAALHRNKLLNENEIKEYFSFLGFDQNKRFRWRDMINNAHNNQQFQTEQPNNHSVKGEVL